MAQWIKCLLCKYKDLSLHPWKLSKRKSTGMVPGACNPSTGGQRRADPGTLLVSQFLQSFTQSLVRDCLKKWGGYGQEKGDTQCQPLPLLRRTQVYTQVYTQVNTQVYTQVHTHRWHTGASTGTHGCMHRCTHRCTLRCTYRCTHRYTHVLKHAHTHIHTRISYILDLLLYHLSYIVHFIYCVTEWKQSFLRRLTSKTPY